MSVCNLPPFFSAVADAIYSINFSLESASPSDFLEQLTGHYGGLENVQEHEVSQYLKVMRALKAAKAEVGVDGNVMPMHMSWFSGWLQSTGDPDAELCMEELQSAIDKVNVQVADAIERELGGGADT